MNRDHQVPRSAFALKQDSFETVKHERLKTTLWSSCPYAIPRGRGGSSPSPTRFIRRCAYSKKVDSDQIIHNRLVTYKIRGSCVLWAAVGRVSVELVEACWHVERGSDDLSSVTLRDVRDSIGLGRRVHTCGVFLVIRFLLQPRAKCQSDLSFIDYTSTGKHSRIHSVGILHPYPSKPKLINFKHPHTLLHTFHFTVFGRN